MVRPATCDVYNVHSRGVCGDNTCIHWVVDSRPTGDRNKSSYEVSDMGQPATDLTKYGYNVCVGNVNIRSADNRSREAATFCRGSVRLSNPLEKNTLAAVVTKSVRIVQST